MSLNTTTLIRNEQHSINYDPHSSSYLRGDETESVDTEQLQFEKSKKEFNVRKVDYERQIKDLQTEKQ